jgi:2-polyprenyl-6-methoxyphenol hydroxylase-like FAD-dependent oxidoreductase
MDSLIRPVMDCAVIGGGPAGSTLAGRLAELGVSVILFERHEPHMHSRGESLPGGVIPILDQCGVLERLKTTRQLVATGAVVLWGGDPPISLGIDEKPSLL